MSGCWSVCSTITSGSRCLWDRTYAKRWERRSAPNDWLQTSTPRYFGKLSGVSGLFTIFEKTRDSGTHTFYALRRGSGRIIAGIYEKTPRRAVVQHGDRQLDFAEIQRTGDGYDRPPQKNHLLRCVQLRKHSKAREKRYSFGYAVSFIFACYQILWTFPKSQYLCSRYLPLVCG